MAGLKVVYDKIREYAAAAQYFSDVLDEGITTSDEVAALVDGVLIGASALAGVGAIGLGVVAATNTYYFAEVRPTATRTRDFLRELSAYFQQVATNLQNADQTADAILAKAEGDLGLPPGTLSDPASDALNAVLQNQVGQLPNVPVGG